MAWQLIYTSAQRTLTPGQSGYGTVARSSDLREALTQRLEQLSYYDFSASGVRNAPLPVIHSFRALNLRGSKYLLLSRIVDARLDFTNRTNHLAHHVVLTPGELTELPSPATLLRDWDGWRDLWSEEPRFLDDSDWGNLRGLPPGAKLPAENWARLTGDAGRAAALVDWSPPGGIQLRATPNQEPSLLDLFAESLQLLDPENRSPALRWQFPFTTLLQTQDDPADFLWRGCPPVSAVGSASRRPSAGQVFNLAELPVPETPRATLARRGPGVVSPGRSSPTPTPTQALVSPADVSAAPLRLNRSTTSPHTSADTPPRTSANTSSDASRPVPLQDKAPEPFHHRATPSVRVPSRRLLLPLVFLLAVGFVLVGGFYRPGWFLERPTSGRPATPAANPVPPDTVPVLAHPRAEVAAAPETPGPPPMSSSEVPAESGAILDAALDRIPSYLVYSRTENDSVELGSIPELDALLRRIFGGARQLGSKDIRARVQAGDLRLAVDPSLSDWQLEIEEFRGKSLSVNLPGSTSPVMLLDCTEWNRDPRRPIRLGRSRMADRGLTLVFQPVAGGPGFEPFRLLLLTGQPPKPINLPMVFLRSTGTNWSDALAPVLLRRLPRLAASPIPSIGYHLRMYAGHPPTELFAPFLGVYQPVGICELALDAHRREIQARLESLNDNRERTQAEAAKVEVEVETSLASDLRLGDLLGVTRSTNVSHLASLAAFARSKGNRDYPDRNDFLDYLRALFGRLELKARHLLEPPRKPTEKDLLQLHGLLVNELKSKRVNLDAIAPSYFTNRWSQLGTVELLREWRNQSQSLSNQAVRLGTLLERIPPSLEATPQVSLDVVDARGDRLFELIRFTDPARDNPP